MSESEKLDERMRKIFLNSESSNQKLKPTEFTDAEGSVYKINFGFFKQLIKSKNGEEELIISQTLFQNIFNVYQIPWNFAAIGILIFILGLVRE